MKKSHLLILALLLITSINLIGAYYSSGYYFDSQLTSLTQFFERLGQDNIFLAIVLLVSTGLINYSLARFMRSKEGKLNPLAPVLSFALGIGITAVVSQIQINGEDLYYYLIYQLGLETELMQIVVILVVFVAAILLVWKIMRWGNLGFLIAIISVALIYLGITSDFEQANKAMTIAGGVVLLFVGIHLGRRTKKKRKEKATPKAT